LLLYEEKSVYVGIEPNLGTYSRQCAIFKSYRHT